MRGQLSLALFVLGIAAGKIIKSNIHPNKLHITFVVEIEASHVNFLNDAVLYEFVVDEIGTCLPADA